MEPLDCSNEEPDGFRMTQLWEDRAQREEEEEKQKSHTTPRDLEIDNSAYLHITQKVDFKNAPHEKLRVHFTYSKGGQKWLPMNVFVHATKSRCSRISCDRDTTVVVEITVDSCSEKPYSLQCTVYAIAVASRDKETSVMENSRVAYYLKVKPVKDKREPDGECAWDTHDLELPAFTWT